MMFFEVVLIVGVIEIETGVFDLDGVDIEVVDVGVKARG